MIATPASKSIEDDVSANTSETLVAQKVIELAQTGVRDPIRLKRLTLEAFGVPDYAAPLPVASSEWTVRRNSSSQALLPCPSSLWPAGPRPLDSKRRPNGASAPQALRKMFDRKGILVPHVL
jgi:hypothetical protein